MEIKQKNLFGVLPITYVKNNSCYNQTLYFGKHTLITKNKNILIHKIDSFKITLTKITEF